MKIAKIVVPVCAAVVLAWAGIAWNHIFPSADNKLSQEPTPGKERMELHFFIHGPSSASWLPEDDFVKKTIENKFNVSLTLTSIEQDNEYIRRLSTLLIANDPPDMWLGIDPEGGAMYALDNALADMTLYISPATMPNYFKYWMNEKELREYQFHNKFMRAPIPYDKHSYRAYYVRKDWLDRLNLPIPSTYDEYVQVLRAFTFNDPDGNGLNDTYGFTTSGNVSEISTDWPEYVKHKLLFPAYYENGRLIDMQMDVRIAEVVTDILQVIDEGLVEPDWFLNKESDYVDKAAEGKVGVVLGNTKNFAFDSNPNSLQARTKAGNAGADWQPFNPFGQQPLRVTAFPGHSFLFSNITAGLNPEKLKQTAAILDWLAGEEGFLLTHYGLEGKHYTRQGNVITLMPEAIRSDMADMGNFLDVWSFFTPDSPGVFGLVVEDPRLSERDKAIYETLAAMPVHPNVGTTLTPPLNESVRNMRSKQNEFQVKMVFTDHSGERWPEYRQEILSEYDGEQILKHYEDKIKAAQKR